MKSLAIVLGGIAAFAAAFSVMYYAFAEYREYRAADALDATLSSLRVEAGKDYPDDPQSVAMQKKALEMSEDALDDASTAGDRRDTAADQFFGFYFINVRTRRAFCADVGVDIGPFVEEFARAHADELAAARRVYSARGIDEDDMWALAEESTRPFLVQDMEDTSSMYGLTYEQVCELYNNAAAEIVAEINLAKTAPKIRQALMATP